jgi:hypothetical protein
VRRTCPKNPRTKWLGLVGYEGNHEWVEHSLWRAAENAYTLVMECRLCGSRDDLILRDEDMLRRAFNLEMLRTLKSMSMKDPVPADEIDRYRQPPQQRAEP